MGYVCFREGKLREGIPSNHGVSVPKPVNGKGENLHGTFLPSVTMALLPARPFVGRRQQCFHNGIPKVYSTLVLDIEKLFQNQLSKIQ